MARISSWLNRPSTPATSGESPTVRDGQDLVLAESPLDARYVGRKPDGPQDEPRGAFEEPEDGEESVVDDAKGDRCRQGRPLRALDGDEFRHQLAEEDMAEGENDEGERVDRDVERGRGGRSGQRDNGAVEERRHRRLADPTQSQAGERDAELGYGKVTVEPAYDRLGDDSLSIPLSRPRTELGGADLDERELRGDEEAVERHAQSSDDQAPHGETGLPRTAPNHGNEPA
jgi:hypothetical protein